MGKHGESRGKPPSFRGEPFFLDPPKLLENTGNGATDFLPECPFYNIKQSYRHVTSVLARGSGVRGGVLLEFYWALLGVE